MKKARAATIRQFYYLHGCRRPEVVDKRLEQINASVSLIHDTAILQSFPLLVKAFARQLNQIREDIRVYDKAIAECFSRHEDAFIFQSLPGAGEALEARLLAAFGSDREKFPEAASIQRYSGIAPVTKQSGNTRWVQRRYRCPRFLRQTFHEWAGQTIRFSSWANAFYQQQKKQGKSHHSVIRALAFKWQNIVWRCWQNKTAYDEQLYLQALEKSGSPLAQTPLESATTGGGE